MLSSGDSDIKLSTTRIESRDGIEYRANACNIQLPVDPMNAESAPRTVSPHFISAVALNFLLRCN